MSDERCPVCKGTGRLYVPQDMDSTGCLHCGATGERLRYKDLESYDHCSCRDLHEHAQKIRLGTHEHVTFPRSAVSP